MSSYYNPHHSRKDHHTAIARKKKEIIAEWLDYLAIDASKAWEPIKGKLEKHLEKSFPDQDWVAVLQMAFKLHCQTLQGDSDIELVVVFLKNVQADRPGIRQRLNDFLPKPHSYIKNLAIRIDKSYAFSNSPVSDKGEDDSFFMGRKRDLEKFGKLLESGVKKGAFLVTGYRGMGKTSFVNFAISKYAKKMSVGRIDEKGKVAGIEVRTINLNLAQRDPSESDILRLMVSHLHNFYFNEKWESKFWTSRKPKTILFGLLAIFIFLLGVNFFDYLFSIAGHNSRQGKFFKLIHIQENDFLFWLQAAFFVCSLTLISFVFLMIAAALKKQFSSPNTPETIIDKLFHRCYASNSIESGKQHEINIERLGAKWSSAYEKEILSYPIASSKEIEYGLDKFLAAVKEEKKYEFIFVFDELDKIEPAAVTTDYVDEEDRTSEHHVSTYLQQIRQRKQSVINIIAGLKNFLTTAQARFVFIAGREMFDATLADVADRQSSVSSIFNYVFYIESFLKESAGTDGMKSSLSSSIEQYLVFVIFGRRQTDAVDLSLFDLLHLRYLKTLEEIDKEVKHNATDYTISDELRLRNQTRLSREIHKTQHGYWKGLISLQNFIIYLTYRSNGSPKKIIKLIQEFVRMEDPVEIERPSSFVLQEPGETSKGAYLFFGFDDQYRIGFINHLYRPFLIRYGQSFNKYSDNIILSTTYLLDHLLKFHPFAFSIPNLELTPEVLSTNKTPLLREHILTIIDYLSNNHLRETEIGIFDYKFYSRTQSELIYISKTFETESAAFNFTLDEGYLIKLHIRAELKSLREVHSKYDPENPSMSLSHLNGILGDLHFFDQEYDDAISAYSDCIKLIGKAGDSMENFIRSQRFRLKLGLTLEKVKSHDDALSQYSDATKEAIDFFNLHKSFQQRENLPALNDVLQIANQGFLALIVLQEKMGIDGISIHNVINSLNNFAKMTDLVLSKSSEHHLIKANMYLVAGNLIYFKNPSPQIRHEDFTRTLTDSMRTLVDRMISTARQHSTALAFYLQGFLGLLRPNKPYQLSSSSQNFLFDLFESCLFTSKVDQQVMPKNESKYLAIFLSHIGDCLLSTIKGNSTTSDWKYNSILLSEIFNDASIIYGSDSFLKTLKPSVKENFSVIDVIKCYYWASKFFGKRGRVVSESFQLRKILYVLHMVVKNENDRYFQSYQRILDRIEDQLLRPILSAASSTAEHSDHHMMSKFQNSKFYDKKNRNAFNIFLNNNISNHPDTREAVSLFLYLKIKVSPMPSVAIYDRYRSFISPAHSFATQYTRIYELNFWGKLNLLRFNKIARDWEKAPGSKVIDKQEPKNGLYMYAFDYLHAQFSALLMMDIYGTDYSISHSLKGFIHHSIAEFIGEWKKNVGTDEQTISMEDFIRFISQHIGFNPQGSMGDANFHYNMAASHMEKAKQLHTQGQEYRKNMDNLIYLEDDINDNAYHFGAAIDRYLMTNGVFDKVIEDSKMKVAKSKYSNPPGSSSKYHG